MIDVVFLLLIFFLCATRFPDPEGLLKTWLPARGGEGIPDVEPGLHEARLRLTMHGGACVVMAADDTAPDGAFTLPAVSWYDPFERRNVTAADPGAVRAYLHAMKTRHGMHRAHEMPVVLDFASDVPWLHILTMIDLAAGLDLTRILIAEPELAMR